MEYNEVKKLVKKGEIAPIYVLYGTQAFLMDELIEEISKQTLNEGELEFNYEQFDLNEHPLEIAVEAAETLPFLGNRRLIVASDVLFLTGAKAQNKIEHNITSLEKYVESPVDFSVLILKVQHEKLDERKKIVKQLKQNAVVCACSTLAEQQLLPWLAEVGKNFSVQVEEEAAQLLIQFVGQNMTMLYNEMGKMAQYVGKGETITVGTVQILISKSIEQDVFSLVEHVVHFRMTEAFSTLHELLKRKEEPVKIVILLARQFRMIYRAQDLTRHGYSPAQMSSYLRVPPFVCKLVVRQGSHFSTQQLRQILDWLAETDYAMKTGKIDKVLALEIVLLKIKDFQSLNLKKV